MTVRTDIDPEVWLAELELAHGAHDSFGERLCVMEAAAYLAGEDHSDHPECVSPVLGAFLRSWNDALPDDERQVLKPYALEVIGTAGDGRDDARAWMATDWLVRVHTPAWLRLAGLTEQAELLEQLAPLDLETCPTILPALKAVRTDAAAAGAAAWDAAGAAAGAAAWAAARDAARAALEPTKQHLQLSALGLLDQMITPNQENTDE